MPPAPSPASVRHAALAATGLLDSAPEPEFDQLTTLASKVLHAPVALVSLVAEDRQFFKSQVGLPEPWASRRETPLTHSFCQHVAASGEPLVISDARAHELVRDNLAIPDLGVVAYAGMPVSDAEGHILGALCAIDSQPREWSGEELEILRALAAQVTTEITLRTAARRQVERLDHLRAATQADVQDLRAPLDAMILGIQALGYLGEWNDAQRECAALCLRDGRTLRSLVDKLLDLCVPEKPGDAPLEPAECSPHYLIASSLEPAHAAAQARGIFIDIDAAADIPSFSGDHERLVGVLSRLLSDAVAHTADGRRVRISAEKTNDENRPALVFRVTDGGGGPEKEAGPLDRHFCEEVAAAHGGRFWRRGISGQGGASCLLLPRRA